MQPPKGPGVRIHPHQNVARVAGQQQRQVLQGDRLYYLNQVAVVLSQLAVLHLLEGLDGLAREGGRRVQPEAQTLQVHPDHQHSPAQPGSIEVHQKLYLGPCR